MEGKHLEIKEMAIKIMFWGYKHVSGTLHLKRYFTGASLEDAMESPFVSQIIVPFEADNVQEAWRELKRKSKTRIQ